MECGAAMIAMKESLHVFHVCREAAKVENCAPFVTCLSFAFGCILRQAIIVHHLRYLVSSADILNEAHVAHVASAFGATFSLSVSGLLRLRWRD